MRTVLLGVQAHASSVTHENVQVTPDICLTKVCFACTPVLLSSPLTRHASPLLRTRTGVTRRQGRVASNCAAALMRDGGARELAASDLIPGHYEGDTQRRLTLLLALVSS